MTTSLYIQCVVMFILGQALQVFLIKIPDIKKNAKIADATFIWKDWWASDWNLVIGTFVGGAILIMALDEVIHWKPEVLNYVKFFFAFIGWGGSNLILAKLSKYQAYFDGLQIGQTNIAKTVQQPPSSN